MDRRIELHNELVGLGVVDSTSIFFQPPETVKLKYPCIIYRLAGVYSRHANDAKYRLKKRYTVLVISSDPDNDIADQLMEHFQYCRFDRRYVASNLYHDSLELYY